MVCGTLNPLVAQHSSVLRNSGMGNDSSAEVSTCRQVTGAFSSKRTLAMFKRLFLPQEMKRLLVHAQLDRNSTFSLARAVRSKSHCTNET